MMKYKTNILTKIGAAENKLDYSIRKLESGKANAVDLVTQLKDIAKQLVSIKELTEAEM